MSRIVEIEIGTLAVTDFPAEVATRIGRDLPVQLAAALTEACDAGQLPRSSTSIDSLRLRFAAGPIDDSTPLAAGAAHSLVNGIKR